MQSYAHTDASPGARRYVRPGEHDMEFQRATFVGSSLSWLKSIAYPISSGINREDVVEVIVK